MPLKRLLLSLAIALLWAGRSALAQAVLPVAEPVHAAPANTAAAPAAAPTVADATGVATLEQLKLQEAQIKQLLDANARQQQQLTRLQAQLALTQAEAGWLPWLAAMLVGSAALSVWLALRARGVHRSRERAVALATQPGGSADLRSSAPQRFGAVAPASAQLRAAQAQAHPPLARDSGWAGGGHGHGGHTEPFVGAAPQPRASAPAPTAANARAWSAPSSGMAAAPSASHAVDFSLGTGVPPREVTVEELLDLEQQVDFFVVLGQHEAAIDLLVAHIRASGGTSPLPYLKLLEIYRSHERVDDYERTRSRFNKRFSAQAPAWGGELAAGRALEHYPEVVERLQLMWPLPSQAQRELENLMLPNERGQHFDLPAFRDLLTLHAVIGDLIAHPEPLHPGDVDVLLPLSEEALVTTSPQPRLSSRPMSLQMMMPRPAPDLLEERVPPVLPGGAVDLDLSTSAPAPREFSQPMALTDASRFRDDRRSGFAPLADELPPRPRNPG